MDGSGGGSWGVGDAAAWYAAIVATVALGWNVVREALQRPRLQLAVETVRFEDSSGPGVGVWIVVINTGEAAVNVVAVHLVTEIADVWSCDGLLSGRGVIGPLERREFLRTDLDEVLGWIERDDPGGHLHHMTVIDSTGKRRRLRLDPEWNLTPGIIPPPVIQGSWLHRGRRWFRRIFHRPFPEIVPYHLP